MQAPQDSRNGEEQAPCPVFETRRLERLALVLDEAQTRNEQAPAPFDAIIRSNLATLDHIE